MANNSDGKPSFKADSNLEKAFLSILYQKAAPKETSSGKEDPINQNPEVNHEVSAVLKKAEQSLEEALSEETVKAEAVPANVPKEHPSEETKIFTIPVAVKKAENDEMPLSAENASDEPIIKSEPEIIFRSESVSKPEAILDSEIVFRSGINPEPADEPEPEAESEQAPVSEPLFVFDPDLVFESENASEPEKDSGPEPDIDAEQTSEPEIISEPVPAPSPEPVCDGKPASEPEMIPAPEPVREIKQTPKSETFSKPKPVREIKPAPEPEPVRKTEPASEPVSEPEEVPESAELSAELSEELSAEFTAPFLRTSERFSSLSVDLFIAALPILGARIWYYGWRTVTVLLTALLVCLFSELVFALLSKKDPPAALTDRNYAVTALTVTLISSPNLPIWAIAVISALAVILFRGVLGLRTSSVRSHPLNPAMAAFSFLLLLWNGLDLFGAAPGVRAPLLLASPDPVAYGVGNPILTSLRAGVLPAASPVSLILGNAAGLLPALFVLFALVYLLVRKAIPWQIPTAMLVSGILFAAFLPRTAIRTDMILLQTVLFEICSGTFLLCAIFCGADTATVPYTGTGKLIFGVLAGAFTMLLRYFTGIVNCAPIGVIAANALTPLINRFTLPRPFGGR